MSDSDTDLDVVRLFQRVSVLNGITSLLPDVPAQIAANRAVLARRTPPEIRPSRHCHKPYECDFWSRCTASKPPDWIYPYLSRGDAFARLDRQGIESAADIPPVELFRLTPTQRSHVNAARTGRVYRSPELPAVMAALQPPILALDFETVNSPIPLWPGLRP